MINSKPIFDDQCDDGPLLQMLLSDCDSHDSDDMLDHVETCERCQHRLDELAADESDWQTTVEVLSNTTRDAITDRPGGFHLSLDLPGIHVRQQAWTESMARQLLSPASHPEMLGRIGRYDVERLIGSGGMGVVFKAYDTELNRPVAVKLLAPYLASSGASRNRFAREARAAAAVVDDHVVPIHNVETDDEHPFLVMKYIAGGSLQQRLDREGPLDVCEVLRIGMQAARGLAAAHAQGLIHRDVKPSNILLDEGVERALLTDFGLARATDDASLTRSGFHPGTPHYMSPEQVRGEEIDARSDLFGLGCVLYALCTGHPPFRSESTYAVLRRITDDTPRPIREINAEIPEWLEGVVMKLLSKSADERFESAEQVAEILEDCLAHVQQPTKTPLPKSVSALAAQRNGRPPISKFIAAAAFAFSLIFLGVLIVIELNKGTITIESDEDDVPIRIMQGDEHVKSLMVSKLGTSTRVSAGHYVIEIDGDFPQIRIDKASVSLSRRGEETVRIRRTETAQAAATDLDPNLIGSWRLMMFRGDEPQWDFGENVVLTFENWNMTWLNEPEPPDRFVYQLLPDNMIRFVPVSESSSDHLPTEHMYRYKLRDADQLELEVDDSTDKSPGILLLQRLQKSDQASTYASQLVQVDTSQDYGWAEKDILEIHVRLIQSDSLFDSINWPDEIDILSAAHQQFFTNLRMRLIVEPMEQSQIEIGLHGDVASKPQREQIVKSIADAYRKKISNTQIAAAQKVIQLLLKSHAKTYIDREVAEGKHRRLVASHDANTTEVAASKARLQRLNELLTKLSDQLLEYGVPAIGGSLETSLQRARAPREAEHVSDTLKPPAELHTDEAVPSSFQPSGNVVDSPGLERSQKALAALEAEFEQVNQAYAKAADQAKDEVELNRVYEEMDPRELMPAKYLALEEQHRGSEEGLQALVKVCGMARSVGNPESAAAKGRVVAVQRIIDHYLQREGLESVVDTLGGGPVVPQANVLLQILVEKSPYRKTQAEALIAQLIHGKETLLLESQLPQLRVMMQERLAKAPPAMIAEFKERFESLQETNFQQLRRELTEKLRKLAEQYSDVPVRFYGTGGSAAHRLSHAIHKVVIGKQAPELVGTDINGKTFRLSELRGKIVVLLFAQSTQDDYAEMYAPLRQLVAKYRQAPVRVVGIMSHSNRATIESAAKRGDLTWTVIPQLHNGPLQLDWGIEGYPTVYIVDREGTLQPSVHMPYYGDGGYDTADVSAAVDKLLKKRTLDPSAARTLNEVTLSFNDYTRQPRSELFDPPIPDLTVEQLRAAMLDEANRHRRLGKTLIASALEQSVESGALTDRLKLVPLTGSDSHDFRQIACAMTFADAPQHAILVVLPKAELRYSKHGWSSPAWGDIRPPLTGSYDLVAVEQHGEELSSESFRGWKQKNPGWSRITVGDDTFLMSGDDARPFDFAVDYDSGLIPKFQLSRDGDTEYAGLLMGNGFVDDSKLSVGINLHGNTETKNWNTKDGKTTVLTFRRTQQPKASPSAINDKISRDDNSYCLVWKSASDVRLRPEFAESLKLDSNALAAVNALLTEIWQEYIEHEQDRTKFSRAADGDLVAEIGDVSNTRDGLANVFWSKLGKIVSKVQRQRIFDAFKSRSDRAFDEIWKTRSNAYPSLLGWSKDNSPVRLRFRSGMACFTGTFGQGVME